MNHKIIRCSIFLFCLFSNNISALKNQDVFQEEKLLKKNHLENHFSDCNCKEKASYKQTRNTLLKNFLEKKCDVAENQSQQVLNDLLKKILFYENKKGIHKTQHVGFEKEDEIYFQGLTGVSTKHIPHILQYRSKLARASERKILSNDEVEKQKPIADVVALASCLVKEKKEESFFSKNSIKEKFFSLKDKIFPLARKIFYASSFALIIYQMYEDQGLISSFMNDKYESYQNHLDSYVNTFYVCQKDHSFDACKKVVMQDADIQKWFPQNLLGHLDYLQTYGYPFLESGFECADRLVKEVLFSKTKPFFNNRLEEECMLFFKQSLNTINNVFNAGVGFCAGSLVSYLPDFVALPLTLSGLSYMPFKFLSSKTSVRYVKDIFGSQEKNDFFGWFEFKISKDAWKRFYDEIPFKKSLSLLSPALMPMFAQNIKGFLQKVMYFR